MPRQTGYKEIVEKNPFFIDYLTELYNRYFLYNVFPKFIEEAKVLNSQLSVFMLDIDNFKYINDSYGHLKGDQVIKEVAGLLKECVRTDDVVIRYAGDEFIILCRGADEALSRLIGNRIIEKINKNIVEDKPSRPDFNLTISGGFAIYPTDGENLDVLIDNADKALYFSKERGKNRVSAFSEVALGTVTYKESLKALSNPGFVDRLSQLNRLKEVWKNVLSSASSIVFVRGKTGLGKSRLLDEFRRLLNLQEAVTLKCICSEQHTVEPYYVISKAIDEYILKAQEHTSGFIPLEKTTDRENSLTGFTSFLSSKELVVLVDLIPSLKNFITTQEATQIEIVQESRERRVNIFKGLRDILVKLSENKGLFLYFDNIQWLDKATFELLNYFLTTEIRHKLMFAATVCQEELGQEDSACKDFLSQSRDNYIFIDLEPFSLDEIKEFVVGIFPNIDAPPEFFQSVYKISQGNSLFMQEILKCLVEDGKILYKNNQWQLIEPEQIDIPSSLEEIIQRRLRKMDPEVKETLTEAAVMGDPVQLELMRQIVKKDQGRLFELVDSVRDKGVFKPQEKISEGNFINDYIHKIIYNGVETNQKVNLHHKIAEVLGEVNKDNLRQVMGELVYHTQRSGDEAKMNEYKNLLQEMSLALFSPQEASVYLEELKDIVSRETTEIETIEMEISEDVLVKVVGLIKLLFVALKNISLFPPTNRLRDDSIKMVYSQIVDMLKGVASLTVSEVERILLINGKRIPYRQEKIAVIESFVAIMLERDIKAIQFLNQIEEREVNTFLTILTEEPDNLTKKGGIVKILAQEDISHIKMDLADYESLITKKLTRSKKQRITNTVLLDYLLGRTSGTKADTTVLVNQLKNAPQSLAKDLIEAARFISANRGDKSTDIQSQAKFIVEGIRELITKLLPGGWQSYRENFAKLISSLDKPLQSNLVSLAVSSTETGMGSIKEMLANFSDNEVVDIICSGHTQTKDSLMYTKELFNKLIAFQPERKDRIKPLIKDKLKSLGLDEAETTFVLQKEYKDLSLYEKKDMLFQLQAQAYPLIGKDNIKDLIGTSVSTHNYDMLKDVIRHFLGQLDIATVESKEILYQILADFINLVSSSSTKFDETILEVVLSLTKRLKVEEPTVYNFLVTDIETAVNWIVSSFSSSSVWLERTTLHKRIRVLSNLISELYKKLEEEEKTDDGRKQKELISQLILQLGNSGLLDTLIPQIKNPTLYTGFIEEIILKFTPLCVERLIIKLIDNPDFSLDGYIYQKKLSNILHRISEPTVVAKLKDLMLMENNPQKLRLLVELMADINNAELLNALSPLIKHKNSQIRREVIVALSHIADAKSTQLLSEMCSDSDNTLAQLAKSTLAVLK